MKLAITFLILNLIFCSKAVDIDDDEEEQELEEMFRSVAAEIEAEVIDNKH